MNHLIKSIVLFLHINSLILCHTQEVEFTIQSTSHYPKVIGSLPKIIFNTATHTSYETNRSKKTGNNIIPLDAAIFSETHQEIFSEIVLPLIEIVGYEIMHQSASMTIMKKLTDILNESEEPLHNIVEVALIADFLTIPELRIAARDVIIEKLTHVSAKALQHYIENDFYHSAISGDPLNIGRCIMRFHRTLFAFLVIKKEYHVKENIETATFIPDKPQVLVGTENGILTIDMESGNIISGMPFEKVLSGRTHGIDKFNYDATLLATPDRNKLYIWNVATGKCTFEFTSDDPINTIAFSPSNNIAIASCSNLFIWNCTRNQRIKKINLLEKSFLNGSSSYSLEFLAFSPDGTMLATGSQDGCRVWSVKTGKCIHYCPDFASTPRIVFTDNNQLVAYNDHQSHIWNIDNGKFNKTDCLDRYASSYSTKTDDPRSELRSITFTEYPSRLIKIKEHEYITIGGINNKGNEINQQKITLPHHDHSIINKYRIVVPEYDESHIVLMNYHTLYLLEQVDLMNEQLTLKQVLYLLMLSRFPEDDYFRTRSAQEILASLPGPIIKSLCDQYNLVL